MKPFEKLNCDAHFPGSDAILNIACQLPEQSTLAPLIVQIVSTVATLAAVGVALYQARIARDSAEEANQMAARANEIVIQQAEDQRYHQASRVSAWIAMDLVSQKPRVFVRNDSDSPIYNVQVGKKDDPILSSRTRALIRPGEEVDTGQLEDPCAYKQEGAKSVYVSFDDALGFMYERNPEFNGVLTELGQRQNEK